MATTSFRVACDGDRQPISGLSSLDSFHGTIDILIFPSGKNGWGREHNMGGGDLRAWSRFHRDGPYPQLCLLSSLNSAQENTNHPLLCLRTGWRCTGAMGSSVIKFVVMGRERIQQAPSCP